jgi:hypothetical protein
MKSIKQTLRFGTLLLLAGFILAGCGVGRAMVIKPPEAKVRVDSVQVMEGNSPVAVPADVKATFTDKLNQHLYGEGGFQRGKELKISYRFIQYDPGSQLTRWFWGGIGNAGEGSLTIETKFFDPSDKELATINVEGRIGSGFFGGALSEAIDKAAEKVAEYTKANFR